VLRVDLAGRVAVVTGGGRGIGEASARALAEAGASVVVAARSATEIERVAGALEMAGHAALAVVADVTREESVAALQEAAESRFGGVDILVSNAGVATSAPLGRVSLEEWNRLFAVNATGAFLCARAFAPAMASRGWGRIVHVASIAGRTAAPYISTYASTKHALVGLTRALAAELAGSGVTVNAVCPGYVDTRMTDESVERISTKTGMAAEAARERVVAMNPQRRLIEAEEVGFVVATLCDHRARGVNGQTVGVDGGAFLG
jgi:NAD(P)-dependent dehydrogenase (short-subunit alcohol dehydrogenase family)